MNTGTKIDQRWQAAMLAGDTDEVLACYASDAIAWLPDTPPAKGAEAIRALFARMLQTSTMTVNLTNTHVETCGDVAMAWGEYTITVTPESGGNGETAAGRYTEILKKAANGSMRSITPLPIPPLHLADALILAGARDGIGQTTTVAHENRYCGARATKKILGNNRRAAQCRRLDVGLLQRRHPRRLALDR